MSPPDWLVERFNGTLKSTFVSRSLKDWDKYLLYLLFAYCEVPPEPTGFSSFDLLCGFHVRGLLDALRERYHLVYVVLLLPFREWLIMYSEIAGHFWGHISMTLLCSAVHGKNASIVDCLCNAQLTVNMLKCQFGKSEVHNLGHVIGGELCLAEWEHRFINSRQRFSYVSASACYMYMVWLDTSIMVYLKELQLVVVGYFLLLARFCIFQKCS